MAQIILEPSEAFEHFHSKVSYTELKDGEVVYEAGEVRQMLVRGERIETPANEAHTLTNVGVAPATVACYH